MLATGNIEEYIVPAARTAFPLVQYTERSDRFCAGLAEGRVGILIDGLPLGYLAPGVLGDFLQAPQDKSESWLLASALTLLRYLCMLGTLLLPALYVAMVTFHQEMIPTRLALSIIAAKQDVPFRSVFEVIVLLLAFEILQEAGLRLPQSIGQTVSIIGGLVVGSAAVEAKIISPAVLIVVAIAGIAGYTMPSQEVAGALRIWRFLLALLASAAGLFGVVAGLSALVIHLAGIESFGVSYLTPFASNAGGAGGGARGVPPAPAPGKAAPGGPENPKPEESEMRRITALLLAGLAALTLTGCRRGPGLLPYAREIEDMELMQTLGVDRAGEGQVEVTASSGSGDPAEGGGHRCVPGQAGTISAAVLGMQGEGSSYLYFGHVGQLLLGEELARQGVEPALDYILRDVETRLDTRPLSGAGRHSRQGDHSSGGGRLRR